MALKSSVHGETVIGCYSDSRYSDSTTAFYHGKVGRYHGSTWFTMHYAVEIATVGLPCC